MVGSLRFDPLGPQIFGERIEACREHPKPAAQKKNMSIGAIGGSRAAPHEHGGGAEHAEYRAPPQSAWTTDPQH